MHNHLLSTISCKCIKTYKQGGSLIYRNLITAILQNFQETFGYTMRRNLPKTISVLIFCMNLLNFSFKNISQTVNKLNFCLFLLKISKYLLNPLNI